MTTSTPTASEVPRRAHSTPAWVATALCGLALLVGSGCGGRPELKSERVGGEQRLELSGIASGLGRGWTFATSVPLSDPPPPAEIGVVMSFGLHAFEQVQFLSTNGSFSFPRTRFAEHVAWSPLDQFVAIGESRDIAVRFDGDSPHALSPEDTLWMHRFAAAIRAWYEEGSGAPLVLEEAPRRSR